MKNFTIKRRPAEIEAILETAPDASAGNAEPVTRAGRRRLRTRAPDAS
jgi:hypothetical protein